MENISELNDLLKVCGSNLQTLDLHYFSIYSSDIPILDLSHNPEIRELRPPTSRIVPDDPQRCDWLISVLSTIQSQVLNELHISVHTSWLDAEYEKLDTVISTDPRFRSVKELVLHVERRQFLDEENLPEFPQFSARGRFEVR